MVRMTLRACLCLSSSSGLVLAIDAAVPALHLCDMGETTRGPSHRHVIEKKIPRKLPLRGVHTKLKSTTPRPKSPRLHKIVSGVHFSHKNPSPGQATHTSSKATRAVVWPRTETRRGAGGRLARLRQCTATFAMAAEGTEVVTVRQSLLAACGVS